MTAWQYILLALGGNAALLLVLGWLARSLGSQLLAKDIERFKAELSAASTVATERLKHDLQIAAVEHQVRFSRLHERRAEVVAETYALLVEAQWASQSFVSVMEWAGEPPKHEKYTLAMNKAAEFYRYFDKNRIYLPPALCEQLEAFIRNMRREVIGFGVYVSKEEAYLPEHAIEKKYETWNKASTYFDQEVPKARAALEAELRGIIGAS
jgi:hypothetical protein